MLKFCCNSVWEIEYENGLKIVVLFGSAMAVTIGIADVVLCGIRTCTRKGIKLPTIGKFMFNADSCIFCLCNKCFHACFVQDLPSDLASWTLQKSCYNFSSKGLGTKLLLLLVFFSSCCKLWLPALTSCFGCADPFNWSFYLGTKTFSLPWGTSWWNGVSARKLSSFPTIATVLSNLLSARCSLAQVPHLFSEESHFHIGVM